MKSGLYDLTVCEDDQKRLRREFSDNRIHCGFNHKLRRFEVWYRPNNSRPYLIAPAINVCHAIYLLKERAANDQRGAKIILAEIDAHNEKLITDKQADTMREITQDLRRVASGRQHFTPSLARNRQNANRIIYK